MRFFVLGFALLALASAGVVPVDYLPPLQELATPSVDYLPPGLVAEEPTLLADDGYRYKTVRRLRLRHRRDVNELVNDYLPPVEQSVLDISAPLAELAPLGESTLLTDDGYRYKTVKKLRFRHRRDVNELVNDYLPPVEQSVLDVSLPLAELAPVGESTLLADDGYRYKTIRKLRLRHRRDVNELVNDYLPPVEQSVLDVSLPLAELAPVGESTLLADDGYRYKTIRKLRLRHRRDVNELVNDYLPPVEQSVLDISAPLAELAPLGETTLLADDGYRYKTIRKLRLRHRRDVNELVNDYLPPVEQSVLDISSPLAEIAPLGETTLLADDGYRYKTVKKLRYRHRH